MEPTIAKSRLSYSVQVLTLVFSLIVNFISLRIRILIMIAYIRGSRRPQKHWTYKERRQLHLRLGNTNVNLGPAWCGFGPVQVFVHFPHHAMT